jgi:hypothetical protein
MINYLTKNEAQEIFLESFYIYKDHELSQRVLNEYKELLNR